MNIKKIIIENAYEFEKDRFIIGLGNIDQIIAEIDQALQLKQTGVVWRSEQLKCYHDNHEWKSDGEGGFFKYCKDCKDYV